MKFLLLWGRLMSKKINDDKGKKGERDLMKTIFKMEEAGEGEKQVDRGCAHQRAASACHGLTGLLFQF